MNTAKKVLLDTVNGVAMTTHMTVILGGNLVKATTDSIGDGIANAEGYLVNKIDKTRDKAEVAKLRKESTDNAFAKTAMFLHEKNQQAREFLEKSKLTMKKAVVKIEEATGMLSPAEADDSNLVFELHNLREQRQRVLDDASIPDDEKGKQIRAINLKIGQKNKLLNQLPKVTPAEAFEAVVPAQA